MEGRRVVVGVGVGVVFVVVVIVVAVIEENHWARKQKREGGQGELGAEGGQEGDEKFQGEGEKGEEELFFQSKQGAWEREKKRSEREKKEGEWAEG